MTSNFTPSLYIDGRWTQANGSVFQSLNPASGEVLWENKSADENDVDTTVKFARQALNSWAHQSTQYRIEKVKLFQKALQENKDEMANIISQETGKPFWETLTEVQAMINKVDISVQAYNQRTGVVENSSNGMQQAIRHKPHGVLAVFGPYNLPGHLPNGHIVPALIAGNIVIFKPSEITPKVAEFMVELWHQSGIDKGVINLLQGEVITGKSLASHPQIDGLLFTGSAQTGNILHKQFAGRPDKMLALEMGGNNPLIIKDIETENIDALVYNIIQSAFISTGQRCTCARRLFLPQDDPLTPTLLKRLLEVTKNLIIDQPFAQSQPFIGPMVTEKAALDILSAFKQLIEMGAKEVLAMNKGSQNTGYITPGIIDITNMLDKVDDVEHFGPLLKLIYYKDFEQAIEVSNQTKYGLAAGLLGGSQDDFDYFYKHIRAGIVNWNNQLTGASSNAPFGGVGISGNHRPSALYAADYCAYPVASLEKQQCTIPEQLAPGVSL